MNRHFQQKRVLAIDPSSGRRFGYAIMEDEIALIDWGVKTVKDNGTDRYLKKISFLISQYQPEVVVIEDCKAKSSRRGARVRELIQNVKDFATNKGIATYPVSRAKVKKVFAPIEAYTKHQIAKAIAGQYPELEFRLPHVRKPWEGEDCRMNIFNAVAFAIAYYHDSRE